MVISGDRVVTLGDETKTLRFILAISGVIEANEATL